MLGVVQVSLVCRKPVSHGFIQVPSCTGNRRQQLLDFMLIQVQLRT